MKKYQNFLSENFHFVMVKFSIYLNRRVFVMAHHIKQMRMCNCAVIKRVFVLYSTFQIILGFC